MSITPVDIEKKTQNISLLVYGLYGTGKTHFAGSAPNCLFLDFEGGTATLRNLPLFNGRAFFLEHSKDLRDILLPLQDKAKMDELVSKLGFQPTSIVIDTLTRMQQHSILTILDNRVVKERRDEDIMEMREWGQLLVQMYRIMKLLPQQGFDIIALAQAREFEDPVDKVRKWLPNLQGQWGDSIGAYFDIVAYLELRDIMDAGVKKTVRRLHLKPSGSWISKSRFPNLPDFIDNPTYPQLKELILKEPSKK